VRKAFGKGHALVINSLHRWCPKAAALAAALKAKVGLPIDVYMYLTPPYSHSYGLHHDVMDAYMVQLVGSKHWQACDSRAKNCTALRLSEGDVLYLPMGAKHQAWTGGELSAHLTVNVERQFYVWGSILQAMAMRLLLPKARTHLQQIQEMQPFGMEGEHDFAVFVSEVAVLLPSLLVMPDAVLRHTRDGASLAGGHLTEGWKSLLSSIEDLKPQRAVVLSLGSSRRSFRSGLELVQALRHLAAAKHAEGLEWVARLTARSVANMHARHAEARPMPAAQGKHEEPQQLSAIASAWAQRYAKHKKAEL